MQLRMIVSIVASIGLVFAGSPPMDVGHRESASDQALECWSDIATGDSLCVEKGADLAAAVEKQFGTHLIVESAPGEATDLVTGQTYPVSNLSGAGSSPAASPGTESMQSIAVPNVVTLPGGSLVLIRLYLYANYGGTVWSLSAPDGCHGGYPGWGKPVFASAYDNAISSFRAYFDCSASLFENTNYSGTSTAWAYQLAGFGSMNDKASSLQLHF